MKKITKILFVLLFALTCFIFTGCGEENNNENKPVEDVYYNITFNDEEGKLLETKKFKENEVPSYNYVKEETDEYVFKVKGWSLTLNGDLLTELPKATKDATYFAVIEKLEKYNVKFVDFDGKVLKEEKVVKGENAIAPTNPTRKGYTFTRWDKELTNVTQDLEITAVYTINQYTITFVVNGGNPIDDITKDYLTMVEEPEKPLFDGHRFVCWCTDKELTKKVEWPLKLEDNITLYASWNESVDIKGYLKSMIGGLDLDPFSYIPESLRPTYSNNNVLVNDITYDFNNFVDINKIKFGGYGEQWHMVIENINQSETFYRVLKAGEDILNTSVVAFNNYLDKNPSDTADHTLKETKYTASLKFTENILYYTLLYKTNISIPLFGDITPQIDMIYDVKTGEKIVRINLNENNAIKYIIVENSYIFGVEYSLAGISRKAYCSIVKDDKDVVNGHIYEFVKVKDKDLINSCADFYITKDYASVVGNKASGLLGFKGYINELYNVKNGKMLGYEVRETQTLAGVSATYNTLWFNLNDISGINNIKMVAKTEANKNKLNTKDIYINNGTKLFEPKYNSKFGVQTSRKFDIELRNMYFYEFDNANKEYIEHKVETPMMFIQSGDNLNDYTADMKHVNNIDSTVTLEKVYLDKILSDYDTLIDIFINNKDSVSSDKINEYIGQPIVIQ